MSTATNRQQFPTPFSVAYWQCAAKEFKSVRTLCFAALIIALRVAIKSTNIPIGPNLNITLGFFINALGSMCYGPLVALASGAISDTLGCLLFPVGPYFFPFIFVEMMGSFLFALFLWRAPLSSTRVILSRFSVSLICNLIMNPILLYYYNLILYNDTYAILSTTRIIKNLALFPPESLLLILFLNVMSPVTNRLGLTNTGGGKLKIETKHIIVLVALTLISAATVCAYYFVYLPLK